MARWCVCGCKRQLKTEDGKPDMHRFFFEPACARKDRREKMRLKREAQRTARDKKIERAVKQHCASCRTARELELLIQGERVKVATAEDLARAIQLRCPKVSISFALAPAPDPPTQAKPKKATKPKARAAGAGR